jgi:hypothetical protein
MQLEQAKEKEKAYEIEIASLHNELACTFSILWNQGARLAAMELPSQCGTPTSSLCDTYPAILPLALSVPSSPSKLGLHHISNKVLPSAAKISPSPKVDTSMFPDASLNLPPTRYLSAGTPHSSPKTKRAKGPAVISKLGFATVELINTHTLNHIVPILNLIVEHNPPPMWATLLTDLNIGDEDYNLLVKALLADWLSGDKRRVVGTRYHFFP